MSKKPGCSIRSPNHFSRAFGVIDPSWSCDPFPLPGHHEVNKPCAPVRRRIRSLSVPLSFACLPSRAQPSLPVIHCRVYDNLRAAHARPTYRLSGPSNRSHSTLQLSQVKRYAVMQPINLFQLPQVVAIQSSLLAMRSLPPVSSLGELAYMVSNQLPRQSTTHSGCREDWLNRLSLYSSIFSAIG